MSQMHIRKIICIFTINEKESAVVDELLLGEGWGHCSDLQLSSMTTYTSFIESEAFFAPGANVDADFSESRIVRIRVKTSGNLPMALAVRDVFSRLDCVNDAPEVCAVLFGCAAGIPGHDVKRGETVLVQHAEWAENGIVQTNNVARLFLNDVVRIKIQKMGVLSVDARASFLQALSRKTKFQQVGALCPDKVIEIRDLKKNGLNEKHSGGSTQTYRQLIKATKASIIDMESFGFLSAMPPLACCCVVRVITDMMEDHERSTKDAQIELLARGVRESLSLVLHSIAGNLTLLTLQDEEQVKIAVQTLATDAQALSSNWRTPTDEKVFAVCTRFVQNCTSPDGSMIRASSSILNQMIFDVSVTVRLGYSTARMEDYTPQKVGTELVGPMEKDWTDFFRILNPVAPSDVMTYQSQLTNAVSRIGTTDYPDVLFGVANIGLNRVEQDFFAVFLDSWVDRLESAAVILIGPCIPTGVLDTCFKSVRRVRWQGFENDGDLRDAIKWLVENEAHTISNSVKDQRDFKHMRHLADTILQPLGKSER